MMETGLLCQIVGAQQNIHTGHVLCASRSGDQEHFVDTDAASFPELTSSKPEVVQRMREEFGFVRN